MDILYCYGYLLPFYWADDMFSKMRTLIFFFFASLILNASLINATCFTLLEYMNLRVFGWMGSVCMSVYPSNQEGRRVKRSCPSQSLEITRYSPHAQRRAESLPANGSLALPLFEIPVH